MLKTLYRWSLSTLAISALAVFTLPVHGQEPQENEQDIVRVEEDWELVITSPDPLQDAPQVSTWMSPTDSMNDYFFGLDLNQAQRDNYDGGGFQTKAMRGATVTADHVSLQGVSLQEEGEVVRWTQMMAVHGDDVVFAIKNGTSATWGQFGGPETLVRHNLGLRNLNQYSPVLSIDSSGVGFASNRVSSLKLLRLRFYGKDGLIGEFNLDWELQTR